jgi:nucleoside-diphosphate-sugar epimerase
MGTAATLPASISTALVTGGGGFVGRAVVSRLLALGVRTKVIGRHRYPQVEAAGATGIVGDIAERDVLFRAVQGVDVVFHVAALAGIWGSWPTYHRINVQGTTNIIEACRNAKVPFLVYTSTPSVVFNGEDICGGDEGLPYGRDFLCHYAKSKVMAEAMVLAAVGDDLKTCALRPHLIWGPGDPHLLPRLLARGREKRLRQVGDGSNLVDITYIDNVAEAHILAAANLAGAGTASGKAYFISQGEPVRLWPWINELFSRMAVPPVEKRVSLSTAYRLGMVLEMVYTVLCLRQEPRMTRFLAEQLAKSHYFSIEQARRELGYEPLVSTEEGLRRTVQWLNNR